MAIKRGLTLGKFAPFHKGHQLLIETALSEMDEVIVVIYDCPETTNVPLKIRSKWIKKLYPNLQVILAWDGCLLKSEIHPQLSKNTKITLLIICN